MRNTLHAMDGIGTILLRNATPFSQPIHYASDSMDISLRRRTIASLNGSAFTVSNDSAASVSFPDMQAVLQDVYEDDQVLNIEVSAVIYFHFLP